MSATVNTNALTLLRSVGDELRRIRLEAGYRTQAEVAQILGCSQGKISYVERGKRWPDEDLLKGMYAVYKVSEPKRAEIQATIRAGKTIRRAWWDEPEFREVFTGSSGQHPAMEDSAEKIWTHSGTYVPGLLQTKAYAEVLTEFGLKDESALHRERHVKARLLRQQVLTRRHPVILNALVLEAALHPVIGGPGTMRDQLEHLRQMSGRPHITVRVIPYSAGPAAAVGASFTLIDFPGTDNLSVALRETSSPNVDVTDDASSVRRTRRRFADLAERALSSEETSHLLEEIEKQL